MWLNLQFPADLVTFIEEILNAKLYFLCSYTYENVDGLNGIGNFLFKEYSSTEKKCKKSPSYKDTKK